MSKEKSYESVIVEMAVLAADTTEEAAEIAEKSGRRAERGKWAKKVKWVADNMHDHTQTLQDPVDSLLARTLRTYINQLRHLIEDMEEETNGKT